MYVISKSIFLLFICWDSTLWQTLAPMRVEDVLTVSQMWVSLGCTTTQGSLKLPWPWHSQCLHFSRSVPLSKRRSKRRHIPGNFLILLCTSYFSVIKEKQKWISGQNSISKFVLKYWQYVLLPYTWYLASEIFLTSPSSIKFDKVLQVVSPKTLPHFPTKGPDAWVETLGNVLTLDFDTCNRGQSLFCLLLHDPSPFQSQMWPHMLHQPY